VDDLPADFWARIALPEQCLLMVDYDGTLAPFSVDIARARPWEDSERLLLRIARSGTQVAVISGRPIASLSLLMEVTELTLIGEHGWESWTRKADLFQHPLSREAAARLREMAREVERTSWARVLEEKRASVAIHTRGLARAEAEEAMAAFRRWSQPGVDDGVLHVQPINGGLETRARGRHKGDAVRDLIEAAHPEILPIYLGDDITDEDAFQALGAQGFSIRVGADDRPSHARFRLDSPKEVAEFLKRWVGMVAPGTSA
jgi:trehalose 6-phosphate phosphatase